jgi:uncharacterized membrane protein YkvA (DUF1232 family)
MGPLDAWRSRVLRLRQEALTLYLAGRHPRTPWYAKALALVVVGYALSPIDLIPDFIPVLGTLDDLLLIPLGMILVLKLIPADVLADCRERAEAFPAQAGKAGKVAAVIVVALWILIALVAARLAIRLLSH